LDECLVSTLAIAQLSKDRLASYVFWVMNIFNEIIKILF